MDADTLLQKYPNVSREELDKIRETSHHPAFDQFLFEHSVSSLHKTREDEKLYGLESVSVGPLVQLHSAQFVSADQEKSLTVFGRIRVEFCDVATGEIIAHDFYNRDRGDAHVLESDGRLSLTDPDYSLHPFDICMPLDSVRLLVDVYIGDNNLSGEFRCGEGVDDSEKFKVESIPCEFGTLSLRYSAIPFAVQAWVRVSFFRKRGHAQDNPSLNLIGKIVARSSDAFGSYPLFDKKTNGFERVDFGAATKRAKMTLSRCWVGISAHSSLILDFDLSEYGTKRRILKESVEFQVREEMDRSEKFIVDDVLIDVNVACYSPRPQGICLDDESSDDEMSSSQEGSDNEQTSEASGDEMSPGEEQSNDERTSEPSCDEMSSSEEQSDEEKISEACIPIVQSDFSRPRQLRAHQEIPLSSCALQIYSIFIGRERVRPLRIYGCIKVSAPPRSTYYLFNKEASDAYCLSEHRKTIPVQNGCGGYDESETLKIDFDLKDVSSELVIRGHVTWHWSSFNFFSRRSGRQLCSLVQGEDGFAAIHYSLFSEAVQAKIEVMWKRKDEHAPLMVFGSLVARYNNYDYAPRYNKDYYRVCLFERNREDPAQAAAGSMISLARDVVVVPIGSSLIVEANLFDAVCNGGITGTLEFRMGCSDPVILEGENHCIYAHIKWEEVGK